MAPLKLKRFRRVAPEWLAAALGLAALGVGVAIYWRESGRVQYKLTITAGRPEGLRQQIAERLAESAARHGVSLRTVATSGSEDALDRLHSGSIDLALVQGGLSSRGRDRVRQVASLKVEPLHLLVKSEIEPTIGEVRGLEFLRGRTVNLSERGSGTFDLAREVLAFAGLRPGLNGEPGDVHATSLGYARLIAETDRTRMPDAVFTVSAMPSPVVRHLVKRHDYRVVPLRFGEAFELDTLPGPRGGIETTGRVERTRVYNTEIPAYTYSVEPPVPPVPVPTFGTRLLLVARAGANSSAVARLLEAGAHNGPGGPVLDPALAELPPELDWHDGALAYRDRVKPLFLGDAVDFLEKSTSLTGGVLGGLFFLWQWYRQRVRRRRDLGFETYMLRVNAVETRALRLELGSSLDLRELLGLQLELSRLKGEALQRFAEGAIAGEEMMSGFLTQVNAARDHLTRLILHERDNLEEEAARQGRTAAAAWDEVVVGLRGPHAPADEARAGLLPEAPGIL